MNKNNTVCFVAGRSGGHIKPALTLAKQYSLKNPHSNVLFFSTASALDKQIIKESKQNLVHIPLSLENIPQSPLKLIFYLFKIIWYTKKCFVILLKYKPQKIISMGGYISIPVCFAAKLTRTPIELYELNAIPGKATKFLAPISTTITVCFDNAQLYFPKHKVHSAAYPLDFDNTEKKINKNKKTVLVLGGSQGSLFINQLIQSWIQQNQSIHTNFHLIHQTGGIDTFDWKGFYQSHTIPAEVFTYSNSIENYYSVADLIICRAGAGTLFEALHFKIPCIVIPLQTPSTDHQVFNAQALAQQYPDLFTIFEQNAIAKNPEQLFLKLNKEVHQSSTS